MKAIYNIAFNFKANNEAKGNGYVGMEFIWNDKEIPRHIMNI